MLLIPIENGALGLLTQVPCRFNMGMPRNRPFRTYRTHVVPVYELNHIGPIRELPHVFAFRNHTYWTGGYPYRPNYGSKLAYSHTFS